MKGGVLVYKCRRCGVLIKDTHVPDVMTAMMAIVYGYPWPQQWHGVCPCKLEMHLCKDGGKGVTEIIGGEEDGEK